MQSNSLVQQALDAISSSPTTNAWRGRSYPESSSSRRWIGPLFDDGSPVGPAILTNAKAGCYFCAGSCGGLGRGLVHFHTAEDIASRSESRSGHAGHAAHLGD